MADDYTIPYILRMDTKPPSMKAVCKSTHRVCGFTEIKRIIDEQIYIYEGKKKEGLLPNINTDVFIVC